MNVEKFVNEYNQASDKEKYIKKHILQDKYVPYEEKVARCENIIKASMYTKVGDKEIFKQNSPVQFMLFSLTLIGLYTDLEVLSDDNLKIFNELSKYNLVSVLLNFINQSEYIIWDTLLDMIIDDVMINTRDLVGYIDNKLDVFDILFNEISKRIGSIDA